MHGNVNGFILSLKIQISFMFQMNQFIQPSQCLNSVPQANAKADDYEIKGSSKKKKGRGGETILITTRKHLLLNEVFFDLHCLWCKRKALPSIWQPDLHFVGIRGQHRGLGEGRTGREQEKDSCNKCQDSYSINTTYRPRATSPLSMFLLDLYEDRSIKSWRFYLICRYGRGFSSNTLNYTPRVGSKRTCSKHRHLGNSHCTHREVLLLFIISVADTVSERTTSSGSLLHDSGRDGAETEPATSRARTELTKFPSLVPRLFKQS